MLSSSSSWGSSHNQLFLPGCFCFWKAKSKNAQFLYCLWENSCWPLPRLEGMKELSHITCISYLFELQIKVLSMLMFYYKWFSHIFTVVSKESWHRLRNGFYNQNWMAIGFVIVIASPFLLTKEVYWILILSSGFCSRSKENCRSLVQR